MFSASLSGDPDVLVQSVGEHVEHARTKNSESEEIFFVLEPSYNAWVLTHMGRTRINPFVLFKKYGSCRTHMGWKGIIILAVLY